jgi:type II secretory pathway component PulM
VRPGTGAIAAFWRQRSRRERVYLVVMLAALAAFAYWFALVAPLRALAANAERRHVAAQAEQVAFPGVLAELALRRGAAAGPVQAAALVQSAAAAGIAVSADDTSAAGRVVLRLEGVPPQALFAWLAQLRSDQGLAPTRATLGRGPSGLEGELVFTTASP